MPLENSGFFGNRKRPEQFPVYVTPLIPEQLTELSSDEYPFSKMDKRFLQKGEIFPLSVRYVCPFLGKDIYPIMISSIVLESVVWRSPETARAFCDFQKNLNSLRPTEQSKQPLLSVRNVCPFLGEDIHPRTIPSLVMKSALWRGSESARAFCNFQKSVNSLRSTVYSAL